MRLGVVRRLVPPAKRLVRSIRSTALLGVLVAPFVDVHTHLETKELERAVEAASSALPRENAARLVFAPPPFTSGDPERYDADVLLKAIRGHQDRFLVFGVGGTLNPIIHDAVRTGDAGPAVRKQFEERAEQLARSGIAGFGELASEHFPGATPYESAPPDHPLFLLLADVAAKHRLAIQLHMEAVPQPMAAPAGLASPPVPPSLTPNIEAFERLLAHNRGARIIWAHAGWDNTGARTPALCRRLLRAHPNLYMDVKVDPAHPGKNVPVTRTPSGAFALDPAWLELFREFPDRFLVGTDQHYPEPAAPMQRWQAVVELLQSLPPDVQRKIAAENATALLSRR